MYDLKGEVEQTSDETGRDKGIHSKREREREIDQREKEEMRKDGNKDSMERI